MVCNTACNATDAAIVGGGLLLYYGERWWGIACLVAWLPALVLHAVLRTLYHNRIREDERAKMNLVAHLAAKGLEVQFGK